MTLTIFFIVLNKYLITLKKSFMAIREKFRIVIYFLRVKDIVEMTCNYGDRLTLPIVFSIYN